MPLVGVCKAADDVTDVVSMDNSGSNGTDLMQNGIVNGNGYDNGTWTERIKVINKIPENSITLDQLLLNLANSDNKKHIKLASGIIDLNLIKRNASEKCKVKVVKGIQ